MYMYIHVYVIFREALLHSPSALMKPHNVLGQCFLNVLVLSCDLEPIGFEKGKHVGTERGRERERERAARRMVQCWFAPHTSDTSGEPAKTYSYSLGYSCGSLLRVSRGEAAGRACARRHKMKSVH